MIINSLLNRYKSYYFLFFYLLFFNNISAQQYYPLIQENAYWQSLEGSGSYIYTYPIGLHFFFKGDTTISNQTYSILNYYDIERGGPPWSHPFLVDSSETHFWGFFREDSLQRTIHVRFPYTLTEQLFFDFSLGVGDTLISYVTDGLPLVVTQITPIFLTDGSIRQKWSFGYDLFFIEGVGSGQGFFYAMEEGLGWWHTINCYSRNGISLYGINPSGVSGIQCFNYLSAIIPPKSIKVHVYPNPTQQQLTIERVQEGKALFRLYNIFGQLVFTTMIQQQQETISLRTLPRGIYRYTIDNVEVGTLVIQPK
ncbi:MAG: T9SS type A sorting domain-containing protein [Aureispira sp.]